MVLTRTAFVTAAICAAGAIVLLAMGCGLFGPPASPRADTFNHAAHAAKGITCGACHQGFESEAAAGMPSYGTCLACHGPAADRKPYPFEAEIQQHAPGDTFAAAPRYGDLRFSHAVHARQSIPCSECHADPDGQKTLETPPLVHAGRCEGCHRERAVAAECSVCHLETRRDRPPPSHLAAAWDRTHGRDPAHGWDTQHERSCSLCHSRGFCDDCHRVERPTSHTEFFRQRGHGFAAGIQREPCMACHQESFCIRCHREEEPRSHFSATWGGSTSQHCVSCHELSQSRCSVCHKSTPSHAQADPIPPPPHPNAAANCYVCHLRPPHADNRVTPCVACHR
jgi:hypothetical protein